MYIRQRRLLKEVVRKHPELQVFLQAQFGHADVDRLLEGDDQLNVWDNLPSLARHLNGNIDFELRALGNEVATAVTLRHELEEARLHGSRAPPIAKEIAAHRAELEYLFAHFTPRQQDGYLAYLRRTP